MRAGFTSDNRGFPHGGFPSITPRWPNGSEERYDLVDGTQQEGGVSEIRSLFLLPSYTSLPLCTSTVSRWIYMSLVSDGSFTQDGTLETSSDRLLFRYSI
jgi:hypothetical protein